jgi:hypothetical protein
MKQFAPLIVGFLLTTVAGGILGYFFQIRSWSHQYEVQFYEQERERAAKAFEEISRLLDKRLYRLRLLYWRLSGPVEDKSNAEIQRKMDDYRAVLYEWNDNINHNLAVMQQYFGTRMRIRLDSEVGAEFVKLGRQVERLWRDSSIDANRNADTQLDRRIGELNELIYGFNLDMLRLLQSGSIGVFNRDATIEALEPPAAGRILRFRNAAVVRWSGFPGWRRRQRAEDGRGWGPPAGRP